MTYDFALGDDKDVATYSQTLIVKINGTSLWPSETWALFGKETSATKVQRREDQLKVKVKSKTM